MGLVVLLVDDSKMSRKAVARALPDALKERAEIIEGSNGEEAVTLYETRRPDLVFLDLTMPVMDGYEALERIMAIDPAAAVLVVSADIQPEAVTRVKALGAHAHIKKPVDPQLILPILADLLRARLGVEV